MSPIRIVDQNISVAELHVLATERYGDMVKAVVDVDRKLMAVGPEMHADAEEVLLGHGSKQVDLWGINIYPDKPTTDWIEFDSMINIRPSQGNRSRAVEDKKIQDQIMEIVHNLTQVS